jgi:DNA-binding NarL/FixJ family response regulator
MHKDILAIIVEDDPYARDLIALMLTRDWRTRVVGEFGSNAEVELRQFFSQPSNRVDVMILDTEVPGDPNWPYHAEEIAKLQEHPPAILYTCTTPEPSYLLNLIQNPSGGYIKKDEILYCIASVISWIFKGFHVITPGIMEAVNTVVLPGNTLILSGKRPVANFTQRESDIARLGIIFNLAQRDIADELVISRNWISELMSSVYKKLNLRELLTGETPLEDFFKDEIVLARCKDVLERAGKSKKGGSIRKAPWISTMAFHLLTLPEIDDSMVDKME